jgi:hypothetical protein
MTPSAPTLTQALPAPGVHPEPAEPEIQKAAYYLWQQKGCPDGCDLEIWLEARERLRHQAPAPAAAGGPAKVKAPKAPAAIHFPGPHSTAPFPPAGNAPASAHLDFRHPATP